MTEESFYDRWSKAYDAFSSNPVVDSWRQGAVETMTVKQGATVVDMGCGSGANLPYLREAVGPEGQVIGVDISEGVLAHAREHVENEGWENVTVLHGDASNPPIESADAVFSSFVTGMFPRPQKVVESWCDLVNEDGVIGLLDVSESNHDAAPVVNTGLDVFTGLTADGSSLKRKLKWTVSGSPLEELTADVEAGHGVVKRRADSLTTDEYALDSVELTVGRFVANKTTEE